MQRQQGLSSPVPKQQQQDDGSSSDAFQQMVLTEEESGSSSKADKDRKLREERSIHLIPLLTFLSFLLLFLCSRDPSAAGKFPLQYALVLASADYRIYLMITCKCVGDSLQFFFFSRHVQLWRGVWEPEAEDAIVFFHRLLPAMCLKKV
jgi:hypothetical protein